MAAFKWWQRESKEQTEANCSFCRKSYHEVDMLAEGAGDHGVGGVFICRNCTELCLAIFEQEKQRRAS